MTVKMKPVPKILCITEQDTLRSVNDVEAPDPLGARKNGFLQK